jgi:hypothetical protein
VYRISGCLALVLLLASGSLRSSAAAPPHSDSGPADRFAPLRAPVLGDDDRSHLEAGGVVVRDLPPGDGEGIGVLVMGLVEAAPDQVWMVMSDCEHQDEFLPRIAYAAVRDRDGADHTCELVFDLPFPLDDIRAATRQHVRRLPDGGYQRYWELLPGDWGYRRDNGSWTVHPYADGRRSLLVNRMDLLPKSALPGWLLRAAQSRQAPATFDAIRARVRQDLRRQAPPLPAAAR